jgi:hypothetical protein
MSKNHKQRKSQRIKEIMKKVISSPKNQQPQSFASGTPPWHTIMIVLFLVLISIRAWPSPEQIDKVATLNTFSNRLFPSVLSLSALVVIRVMCSLLIIMLSLNHIFYSLREPPVLMTTYPANSKLKHHQPVELRGIRSMYPFTMWVWNLLGLSCGLNAYLAFCAWQHASAPQWLLRLGILLFEAASPTALLYRVLYGMQSGPNCSVVGKVKIQWRF